MRKTQLILPSVIIDSVILDERSPMTSKQGSDNTPHRRVSAYGPGARRWAPMLLVVHVENPAQLLSDSLLLYGGNTFLLYFAAKCLKCRLQPSNLWLWFACHANVTIVNTRKFILVNLINLPSVSPRMISEEDFQNGIQTEKYSTGWYARFC